MPGPCLECRSVVVRLKLTWLAGNLKALRIARMSQQNCDAAHPGVGSVTACWQARPAGKLRHAYRLALEPQTNGVAPAIFIHNNCSGIEACVLAVGAIGIEKKTTSEMVLGLVPTKARLCKEGWLKFWLGFGKQACEQEMRG